MAPSVPEDAVREELSRVLQSDEFRSSKRSQEFLRYVVEHTLRGEADLLKERTIGIDVFGRTTDYDPSEDATVRVKASEVRKRLGLYYAHRGAHDPMRIELPSGTYVPEFRPLEEVSAAESRSFTDKQDAIVPSAPATSAPTEVHSRVRPVWVVAIVAAVVSLATVGVLWIRTKPAQTTLDQFWAPVVNGSAPISLCAAFVPVWGLDRDPTPENPARVEEFVKLTDQFVGGGDLIAASRLSAMLTKMQRPFFLRVGNDVSFNDLRSAPAILIGYSYTRWKEISSQMRFFIDATRQPVGITDNGSPTKWTLPNLPADRRTNEDYAIVSRLFHPDTHAMMVELAGVTQYGTDAAAELVTNPDLLADALHDAPRGWQTKNLQFVLHMKVISGTPATPKVVATYYW